MAVCWDPIYYQPVWTGRNTSHFFRLCYLERFVLVFIVKYVTARASKYYVVHDCLTRKLGDQCIGRGGANSCPQRSPDLSTFNFFIWSSVKNIVNDIPIDNDMELAARISVAVREIPSIFQNDSMFRMSMQRYFQECIATNARNSE